jgi:hypothetical protein
MRRVIRKRIRHRDGGIDLAADLNAVIAVNDGRVRVPEDGTDDEAGRPQGDPAASGDAHTASGPDEARDDDEGSRP